VLNPEPFTVRRATASMWHFSTSELRSPAANLLDTRPDQIWATDIKYVWVGAGHCFLICFLDEYSPPHYAAAEACRGPAPPPGEKPTTSAADAAIDQRADRC
jgi:hypothetical protein